MKLQEEKLYRNSFGAWSYLCGGAISIEAFERAPARIRKSGVGW